MSEFRPIFRSPKVNDRSWFYSFSNIAYNIRNFIKAKKKKNTPRRTTERVADEIGVFMSHKFDDVNSQRRRNGNFLNVAYSYFFFLSTSTKNRARNRNPFREKKNPRRSFTNIRAFADQNSPSRPPYIHWREPPLTRLIKSYIAFPCDYSS